MSAAALKQRLRADLKAAMQARAADEVRLLRTLIATLDNAEAVPADYDSEPRAFGGPGGEVARLELDAAAVERLLASEVAARFEAAEEYARHGQDAEAERLRGEAGLIVRYRTE